MLKSKLHINSIKQARLLLLENMNFQNHCSKMLQKKYGSLQEHLN